MLQYYYSSGGIRGASTKGWGCKKVDKSMYITKSMDVTQVLYLAPTHA
jgi:hypothetical protein